MSALTGTLITIGLIALSALFVIIEFALLGARRHRLEELAPTSVSARAALRGQRDRDLGRYPQASASRRDRGATGGVGYPQRVTPSAGPARLPPGLKDGRCATRLVPLL